MLSEKALKWVHGIGYVCTALVAVELIGLGGLGTYGAMERHRANILLMSETRTHDGPIARNARIGGGAFETLAALPPLSDLGKEGFRFAAMPGLGWYWYALSLGGEGENVAGTLIITQRASQGNQDFAPPQKIHFTISRAAYAEFLTTIDRLTVSYGGDYIQCLDGMDTAFERLHGARITSGEGNAGCSKYYNAISTAVLPIVRQAAGPDWQITALWGAELKQHVPREK